MGLVLLSVIAIIVSLVVLAGLATLTIPGRPLDAPPGQPTPAAAVPTSLGDVRACAGSDFDSNNGRCGRNRANTSFQAKQIACSANVTSAESPAVRLTLLYNGKMVTRTDAQTQRHGTSFAAYAGFSLGDVNLPGGRWTCQFDIGQHEKSAPFQLNGPTGQLLYTSACDINNLTSPSGVLLCTQDQAQISNSSGVACTAVVAGALDRQVKLDMVFDGASGQPVTRSFYGTADTQLFGAAGRVGPTDVNASGSTMPAGSYTCTWSVDGQQVGQKKFQVQ